MRIGNFEIKGFTINRTPNTLRTLAIDSHTGVRVTEDTALSAMTVWACVRLISETIASLPLHVYARMDPRGKQRAIDHPLYRILHDHPNPEMTSFSFREALMGHLLLWGNAFAEIEWEENTKVKALWPLRPDMMQVVRQNGQIVYRYMVPTSYQSLGNLGGIIPGEHGLVELPAYRVLHIPGLGFDGMIGYSPIAVARRSIGLALATEEFGGRFFGNSARPDGYLRHPKTLSKEAQDRLASSWEERHKGLTNAERMAILEEGMEYQAIGIPPDHAQFLETRKFQKGEIASFFHVPAHMVGDLERATFSNIEQQALEYVIYTMRPWLVRWEQAINWKLLTPSEQTNHFVEFLVDALLRGDIKSRYEAYAIARQWGWLSANDVREIENMNPLPDVDGDHYLTPMNMTDASLVGNAILNVARNAAAAKP